VEQLSALLPIIAIVAIFYLLVIRPQSKRAKQQREMQSALGVGSEVMLTSGIFGTLVAVDDPERVDLRIADGVVVTVARQAIATVVPEKTPLGDTVADPAVETTDDTRKEL
jgi:preprotein translocase subunit YajC